MITANSNITTEDYQAIMKFFYDFKNENVEKRSDALAWFFLNLESVFKFPVYILMGNMKPSDPNIPADQRVINPNIDIIDIEDGPEGMLQAYALRTYAFQPTHDMQTQAKENDSTFEILTLDQIIFQVFKFVQQENENTILSISFPSEIHQQFFSSEDKHAFITLFNDDIEVLRKTTLAALSMQNNSISEQLWTPHLNHKQLRKLIYSFGLQHTEIEKIWCWILGTTLYVLLDCPSSHIKQYQQQLENQLFPLFQDSELTINIVDLAQTKNDEILQQTSESKLSLFFQKSWNHFFLFRWWRNLRQIPIIALNDTE